MDEAYAQAYRELYERHWWWRARESFLLARLREIAPAEGFGAILDVGCGDGLFFDKLAEFGVPEGVEPAAEIVTDHGRQRGRIHIGFFDTDFDPGRRYGLILMLDVLEHLAEPSATLAHAASLLEPDGRIILTVPAFRCLWTSHDDFNHHLTRYRRGSLMKVVGSAGLVAQRCRYFFHKLFFFKLAVRLAERVLPREAAMAKVPPAAVNGAMYWFCRVEQAVHAHLPLPWGNSLFAILSHAPDKTRP